MDNLNLYVDLVGPRYKKRSKFSKIFKEVRKIAYGNYSRN